MRKPAVSGSRLSEAHTESITSPIGGWNARDALGEMEETDAVTLINIFPKTSTVMFRMGHSRFVTGISGKVESLMAYAGPTSKKMFGAAGAAIYDVTSAGAVGAAVQSGLTNARWQHVNVSTAGGNFLYAVNGADKPRLYDGTNWTAIDGVSTPAITGVTTTNLIHVNLFKNRLWFTEKNTLKVWYLPVDSVGGAVSALNFQSVARRGGYLVGMGTWTIDAGSGIDDLAVFFTSEGEVIVYRGTDPSSASTWALVGVWQLGSPIGRRCFLKYGGDLLYICQDGVVPLSAALQSSRVNPRVAITDKIQGAVSNATTAYAASFGWQLVSYPKGNMVFVNIPVQEGNLQEQYVMNTITKSWCRFQGWNANCWELFSDDIYFGGNGFVGKAWDTFADNGADISVIAKQAFNYFGSTVRQKEFTFMRPSLLANGAPAIYTSLDIDFEDTSSTAVLSIPASSYATWDSAAWDSGVWGGDLSVINDWQGVSGIGFCGAIRLQAASNGIQVEWASTDVVMKLGEIL